MAVVAIAAAMNFLILLFWIGGAVLLVAPVINILQRLRRIETKLDSITKGQPGSPK